jgi:hypothetical protein
VQKEATKRSRRGVRNRRKRRLFGVSSQFLRFSTKKKANPNTSDASSPENGWKGRISFLFLYFLLDENKNRNVRNKNERDIFD